jgi:undecaprenyl pyrophosphate phosphatase UppP
MKYSILKKLTAYLYNNFTGNLLGFIIGMASTRLVSHFFTTRSIRNLWGLTAKKAVVDKKTFGNLELIISIIVGFIVFEIISKEIKKRMDELLPKCKMSVMRLMVRYSLFNNSKKINAYAEKDAITSHQSVKKYPSPLDMKDQMF